MRVLCDMHYSEHLQHLCIVKMVYLVDLPNPPAFFGDGLNPVGLADNTDRNFYYYSALGDAFIELDPIKNLKIKSDLGGNLILTNYKQFFPTWGIDRFINSPNALAQSDANRT